MRRPLLYAVVALVALAWSGPRAEAGILGGLKDRVAVKAYSAMAKVQSLLPLPGLSHPCVSCGIPVPKLPKLRLPSLHKRRCIDPIRSPRDFFMLR